MNIATASTETQGQTILIVDDTPANLGVLVDQLDDQRFQVVVAQDGAEGIKRAQFVLPDIILLDVMMPGMNGFEVCRHLKRNESTRDIPVIFMTALTDSSDKIAGFEAGGVDYVTKPFQIEEVLARINTHLALCTMQQRLTEQNQHLQQEVMVRQRAEEDIRQLMLEQQRILENTGVGIAFLMEHRIVRCNQKLAAMFGYPIEDLLGQSPRRLYAREQTGDYLEHTLYQPLEKGGVHTTDTQCRRRDGSTFWGDTILTALDQRAPSKGAILVIHDIDQRKRAEALRSGQGQVFEMMAVSAPLGDVLLSLAKLIESQLEGALSVVLLLDGDGQHLHPVAAPGLPESYRTDHATAFPAGEQVTPGSGPNGAAIQQHQAVFVSDTLPGPLWNNSRTLAALHGLRASWSIPILAHQGQALGVFALHFREARQPTPIEMPFIEMAARIASIAIERKHAEERIQFMAHHDALTGLPNRALLEDRLNQGILFAQRYGRLVTVVFIDLDHFKLINDSLGHKAGDELLKTVAQRMLHCVRRTDTVVRLGGDEFVIILFDQPDQSRVIAPTLNKIREAIAQPIHMAGHELQVTCSMGLATYPHDGQDVETLLRNADAAMYRAKEVGRNNFQLYSSDMNVQMQERLALQEGLLNALSCHEFLLHYQPQLDLHTGHIIGVEALLRWQHPELGLIAPAKFIQLAEETGLIVPIGDWVLQTACKQNKAWQDAGLPPLCISVNVSARQFREKDLLERVGLALRESGLAPHYLELELTESLVMQDLQQAIATMQKLNDMGIQLSIDDFGTGYSSLSALKNFPVARLKIDKSFVSELPNNQDDRTITRAVISLGRKLHLKVIAEGVEDAAQLEFLRANDCDEIQGYHFSRPISAMEFEKLMLSAGKDERLR
ncbi:MAG: EAL domain-containing protein [Pseudogulbenkiania sp.]|nr:EAL domain-containing protein [Pseudogulbenkiania sp.]